MADFKKYLETGGVSCPFCGSHNIEGQSFDIDEDGVTQEVGCNDCCREWIDSYKLHSITVIDVPLEGVELDVKE
ncbi:MAG: DUF1178 family protein [Syntrophobacteraceae bacterium]|nr:DUF1178 family protein [Syntrophobacteraceae bacterium]